MKKVTAILQELVAANFDGKPELAKAKTVVEARLENS